MRKHLTFLGSIFFITILCYQPILGVTARGGGGAAKSAATGGKEGKRKETVDKKPVSKRRAPGSAENRAKPIGEVKKTDRRVKRDLPTPVIAEIPGQSATLLPDATWLLLGGSKDGQITSAAVIKNEATGETTELSAKLIYARSGHTATVLPGGKILVFGGRGANGGLIASAELFDFETKSFQEANLRGVNERYDHTATLLTNGWVLLAGGVNQKGRLISQIELLNGDSFEGQKISPRMQFPRRAHRAELQADGSVLVSGGFDQNGLSLPNAEFYDAEKQGFQLTGIPAVDSTSEDATPPRIEFAAPGNGANAVAVNVRPVLRFSKLLNVKSLAAETVALSAAGENATVKLVPAENGRLLFIQPAVRLKTETFYLLELSGVKDKFNRDLTETMLSFQTEEFCDPANSETPQLPLSSPTASKSDYQIIDEDSWMPDAEGLRKGVSDREGEKNVQPDDLPPLRGPEKVTALAGRILSLSQKPLAGVTLELQNQKAVSDGTGRFLLVGLKPEKSALIIRGETVPATGKTYATFEVLVDLAANQTTVLPYTIWLPVLDRQNEARLLTPAPQKTVVTTPRVPGMEVLIPAQSVLKMPIGHGMSLSHAGMNERHEMKTLGITPIPINRPPFPLPDGLREGLLFTLQMHGAKVQGANGEKRAGLRFVFPNSLDKLPGERVSFWNYDSTNAGWIWYGYGTVSEDGQKIIPEPGVELAGMQCLSLMSGYGPYAGPAAGSHGFDGDPVDLQTGLFVHEQTDLVLPDTIPIKLTRTYRQNDGRRDFGIGFTHPYNMFIAGDTQNYGELILPDGGRIRFERDRTITNHFIHRHTATPTAFYGAELRYYHIDDAEHPNGEWVLKMRDGSKMIFARNTAQFSVFGIHSSYTALYQIIDRHGNKVTMTRDSQLRLSRIISPNNKWIELSYGTTSGGLTERITQVRDNIGRIVSYQYDDQDRLSKVTDAEGGESFYTYDAAHRMLTLKDARGTINLINEYNAQGRISRQTAADNTVYQFAYTVDLNNKVLGTDVTNPRGLVRRMLYNEKGYPTSETFGVGRADAWSFVYDRDTATNRVLTITDSWNQATKFNYDTFGNLLETVYLDGTPAAVTTKATYTEFDNVATTTDALNRTVNFTYDDQGSLLKVKDWLDKESNFTYTAKGQLGTVSDQIARVSKFRYDRGALVEAEDPTGRKMRQFVDSAGRATRTFDPLGGVTKYRYNKFNRPVQVTDKMGRTGALKYDKVGSIEEITDSRGGKIKYTYDAMGRTLTRTNQSNQVETFVYDAYGNLWKAIDFKNQITEFTYDVFDRPTLVRYHDNTTTAYSYDAKGRTQVVTDSAGGTIVYGYDALDRVNLETTVNGTVEYGYDAGGRVISMKSPGQAIVAYGYDPADRIETITQDNKTVSFGYDSADRRDLMTLPNGIAVSYTYDTSSQLKTMTYRRGMTTLGDVAFDYDALGRRTRISGSLARVLSPTPFENASYSVSNQQTAVNNQTLTFDTNGNLTSDGAHTYTWNARDELVGIAGAGLTASFQYDGEGRRIGKTVNGVTTGYVYDGLQVVEEREQNGPTVTQLAGGLDEVFWRKATTSGGTTSTEYLLADALGSTWGLADGAGNVTTEYKYDVFGQTQTTGASSTTKNSLQFTGRENDGTGLYYYRNRYYSPSLRRFISRDPLREAAGENEYAYVGNNPISLTDPLGLYHGEGGGHNFLNDLGPVGGAISWYLDGDSIAKDSWTLGNYCAPASERLWAGARLMWTIGSNFFGGRVISKALGLFKRIPFGAMAGAFKKSGKCFVAGTLVHSKAGLKKIEEIKAGDEVLSYNERTKQTEYKPVVETYIRQTEEIVRLQIAGESKAIETTPEHPFYVRVHKARDGLPANDGEGEWQAAGSLRIGDEVRLASGAWTRVEKVDREAKSETVYNFAVADNHNYFVGKYGLLAHNTYKFALGLQKNLDDFARSVGGKRYVELNKDNPVFDENIFAKFANEADQIHFNLKDFNFDRYQDWVNNGARLNFYEKVVTNWEYYQIANNPKWLFKTIFHP